MEKSLKKISLGVALAFAATAAQASGYHFGTQSVTAQSTANAAAAEAADASTIFYNPAGLTKLENHEITAAINAVAPHIKYSDAEATYRNGGNVNGETGGKITDDIVIAPHVYGAYKVNDDVTVGVGMYVPFGSSTEYSKDSVLRHHLNQLGLTTIAVEPVVAYQFHPQHSIGVGAIAQYSTAELRKYADWDASGGVSEKAGFDATGHADGHAEVKGKDWGFGYQLAWMWDVNDRTRVGVNYRSKVSHTLKGTADWYADGAAVSTPNPVLDGQSLYGAVIGQPTSLNAGKPLEGRGYVPHEKALVKIVTPESLSVHGMYKATDKLNLFGDITWTRHSRFNKAELVFENTKNIGDDNKSDRTIITPNWRNTYKVAIGGSYQYSEPLQLRAGIAFDQSPVRGAESRLNTLPDGNRIWYSVGAKYQYRKNHVFDVAYSHIHINDTSFNAAASTGDNVDSKGAATAKFNNYANILGVQYSYKFR
ncbi:OmpP1/FadL family transporter [Neisseria sp. CCUG17229]|uniref:OmpP1/FadL family transporter n=1 Tax=Neisseria sp. CCUG17229 TaxID=3392036 RepID=UPI003A0FEEEE